MDVPDLSKSKVIDDILDKSPTSVDELEELHLYKILLIIASYIALGVGALHFVLSIGSMPFGGLIFKLMINLVFGFLLLLSFHNIEYDKIKWSIMTILFSIVLIVLGGVVGLLAGTFSLFGILLSFIYD
ncbi:MAG: hypothetical protein ACQEQM_02870 [Thermoplasmatota archaeon]